MEYEIRDGLRTIRVVGSKLAESSSESPNKDRWVEFALYRSANTGTYVVSRVGKSRIFHQDGCPVVYRNHLTPALPEDLEGTFAPCVQCNPNWADPEGVFPEVPRYHSQVCTTPEGVLNYLTKVDDDGSEYLTRVARNLLETASDVDADIYDVYTQEVIL